MVWYLWGQELRDHHYILKPKSVFVEEETMTRDEMGTSYDGEQHIKIIELIIEDMKMNIMKGFEFLAIQSLEKYIDFRKTKGENASVCLKEKKEETHEPPSYEK